MINNFIKKAIKVICCFTLLLMGKFCLGQQADTSAIYLERAITMYSNVWKKYRVPKYAGLFLENYPSKQTESISYLENEGSPEKEVSYLWPLSGVFSATNVLLKISSQRKAHLGYLDTLVSGIDQYKDTVRFPTGYQAYPAALETADRYYDDNGLVGIDYMEAYLNTENQLYLERAKEVFTFIISGWDEKLGGGVTWLEGQRDQKPACSNGMATLTALKIYQGTKEPYYLNWGKKFYEWMHGNLRDENGVYWNDKKMDNQPNKVYWTYNSGAMLEASVLLYQFTGEKKYLLEAQQIAKSAYEFFHAKRKSEHLLLDIDLPWFVTVLFRGYEALYHIDGDDSYIAAIEKSLNYAWDHSRDQYGFVSHTWLPEASTMKKTKWLLDQACIAELYSRLSIIRSKK